ncbi:MAG: hypothetical protein NZM09_04255 [Ignavibacterium sp.]|nr:hypothetical protein [Ignavibacterium sp.]MCX7610197.1 hypothetical protein [Ignavibacterium sp.]MDW8374890.1 hypothetical protein [Ignavibacteriales bacterium]
MNKNLLIIFFIAGLLAFFPISCDIKSPIEGISVKVKNIPRTTSIRVEFLDQNAKTLVSTPITLKFGGRNKNDVITDVNQPISQMTVRDGIAYFAIKDNIIPTAENPVEVILIVQSSQYLSTSSKLLITKTGSNSFVVNLLKPPVNPNIPAPAGITANEQSFGNIATSAGTTVNIVANSGGNIRSILTVPSGTILRDANGNALSGNVRTQITYFDATSRSAIPSFPGGFSVNTNTSGNGAFVTAGFSAINMFVNDTPVESFSRPVSVQIQVNPNTRNPITGTTVRPGDQIPMWSYNESTGTWNFEGNYTLQSSIGPDGKQVLFVEKSDVTHLSYWNLDWYFNACYLSSKIKFVGGCWDLLYWYIEYENGQGFLGSGSVFSNDPEIVFLNAPSNTPVRILAFESFSDLINYYYNRNQSLLRGSLLVQNLCAGTTQTFNLQVNTQSSGQTVNLTVRGRCPNGNILDQGTLDIEIFKNGFWQHAGRIINGQITLNCLQIGQTYNFRAYYNGQYYYREQQITSANMVIEIPLPGDIDFCN